MSSPTSNPGNFLWNYLRTNKDPRAAGGVGELLGVYDLVGTTELFDETMVVLATRLGVPLGDVLSVSAKNTSVAGARDPTTGEAFVRADASQIASEWAERPASRRAWPPTTRSGATRRPACDATSGRWNASSPSTAGSSRRRRRSLRGGPRNFEEDRAWRDNGAPSRASTPDSRATPDKVPIAD
ncbi:hypothetical protein JL720_6619 [Aureococcus anophagefferens]|nr:hypothetical protein JL720_6619 [Aureococcus anophagefferens]